MQLEIRHHRAARAVAILALFLATALPLRIVARIACTLFRACGCGWRAGACDSWQPITPADLIRWYQKGNK